MVAGQKAALGRAHAGKTITITNSPSPATTAPEPSDTHSQPVENLKASRPRKTHPAQEGTML
jgi:hypothetical protein